MNSALPSLTSPATAPAKRKRGRPALSVDHFIGQVFGRLIIEGDAGSLPGDPNRRVDCSCECGSSFSARLQDIREGKQQSCGCLGEETFDSFRIRKAAELTDYQRRQIFHDSVRHYFNDPLVAVKNGVSQYAIREAVKMHEASLLKQFGEIFKTSRLPPSRTELKISQYEYAYLRKHSSSAPEGVEVEWEQLTDDERALILHWCTPAAA